MREINYLYLKKMTATNTGTLSTNNSTPLMMDLLSFPNDIFDNCGYLFVSFAFAILDDGSSSAQWSFLSRGKILSGVLSIDNTSVQLADIDSGLTGISIAVVTDNSDTTFALECTGLSSAQVQWAAWCTTYFNPL